MTHADAFLQEILANPDDAAPRLIFADWLEEQGDAGSVARAELIRVQCALTNKKPSPQQRPQLIARQDQILEQYGHEWARPIRRLVHSWEFHRGFIDEIVIWDDVFLTHAERLFRRAPIQHLHLRPHFAGMPRPIADLADNECLRRLRSLDLSWNSLESRHVRALVVSPHLTDLASLDLARNRIGDSGIRALAEAPLLGRLRQLNLNENTFGTSGLRVLAESLERLARSPGELRLQRLDLMLNRFSSPGRRLLADSPLLRRLTRTR
jgi:uncharacterized protein (TIGR02996 family)